MINHKIGGVFMPANNAVAKEERLSVRMPREIKNKIRRAADLRGITLSDFIVSNMISTAESVIQEHGAVLVSERDAERLMAALDNPPKPNRALLEGARDYKNAILNGEIVVRD
jgi:uncharacterized protein (DUF1778 family)